MEVGYCYDRGIPYSDYLERWSDEDRAKVKATALERSERCQMCGTSAHEWEEDPDAYEAVRLTCPGCMRREVLSDDRDAPSARGSSVRLMGKAAAMRMREEVSRREAEGTLRPRRRRDRS